MLELQDSMNQRVHPEWRDQGYEWYRAVWVECAELMDHYGWKWWKKQTPDLEQVKLELIDIWHFGLSYLLVTHEQKSIDDLAELIQIEFSHSGKPSEFKSSLESFVESVLLNRGFSVREFATLMASADITFDALYVGYIGKNVLNFFRQDHGYKDGSYVKVWDGREDNEHLVELCERLNHASPHFKDELYEGLKKRYTEIVSHY